MQDTTMPRQDGTDRIVRRSEVARLLSRSPKTIDRLAERGVLMRVRFPHYQRSAGYRLSDIKKIIASGSSEQIGIEEIG